jgi:hypothetical protein
MEPNLRNYEEKVTEQLYNSTTVASSLPSLKKKKKKERRKTQPVIYYYFFPLRPMGDYQLRGTINTFKNVTNERNLTFFTLIHFSKHYCANDFLIYTTSWGKVIHVCFSLIKEGQFQKFS